MSLLQKNTDRPLLIKRSMSSIGLFVILCLMSQLVLSEGDEKEHKAADIRLLIDISGSMKKNDSANLRIPSVSLLTELIPDGDKAGVWTFGQASDSR